MPTSPPPNGRSPNYSDVREAELALLPTVSLTGSAGSLSEDISKVPTFPETAVWDIAASAAHSIINRGQTVAETRRRKAVRKESIADYQKVALNAFREVENALLAEQTLRSRDAALDLQCCYHCNDNACCKPSGAVVQSQHSKPRLQLFTLNIFIFPNV